MVVGEWREGEKKGRGKKESIKRRKGGIIKERRRYKEGNGSDS